MAKIKTVKMSYPASTSIDVVGYRLYVSEVGKELTYESERFNLGNVTTIDLSIFLVGREGIFNLGVTAVDDLGNESEISILNNVSLDFSAPNPPGKIEVIS